MSGCGIPLLRSYAAGKTAGFVMHLSTVSQRLAIIAVTQAQTINSKGAPATLTEAP
jgi:hypothetical protein